ncbi:hypothetical protein FQN51_003575 [Onygenales sp. PD_10]|nr:hypothetical protein FQN51_003575 [Onygenales sp. PD_10]
MFLRNKSSTEASTMLSFLFNSRLVLKARFLNMRNFVRSTSIYGKISRFLNRSAKDRLSELPTEILGLIAGCCLQEDVKNLRLTNWVLSNASTGHLDLITLIFPIQKHPLTILHGLSNNPVLARRVHTIVFDCAKMACFSNLTDLKELVSRKAPFHRSYAETYDAIKLLEEQVDIISSVRLHDALKCAIGNFTNLQEVRISLYDLRKDEGGETLNDLLAQVPIDRDNTEPTRQPWVSQIDQFMALMSLLSESRIELSSIDIDSSASGVFGQDGGSLKAAFNVFRSLKSIKLRLWDEPDSDNLIVPSRAMELLSSASNLESLSILVGPPDWESKIYFHHFVKDITWKNLKQLCIKYLFVTEDSLVAFLDRHRTIEDLTLANLRLTTSSWRCAFPKIRQSTSLKRATVYGGFYNGDPSWYLLGPEPRQRDEERRLQGRVRRSTKIGFQVERYLVNHEISENPLPRVALTGLVVDLS